MTTRNFVPRADNEGGIGTALKRWATAYIVKITASEVIISDGAGNYMQLPKLTTAERDALSAANGMVIYNTTTLSLEAYESGAWGSIGTIVTTARIAASAVTATKIAASAVTTAKINTSAVTTAKIAASAITTTLINTTAVTAAKIAPNAVTTTKIAASAVTTPKIKAGNVTTTSLAASAVITAKIDASAVTTPKIKAGNVTTTSLAASAVTTPKIKAGNVTTTSLAASAVTATKIAASAVTTAKINTSAVTTAKIAASAITTTLINTTAVTAAKIAPNAVTTTKIAASAVTTPKIKAGNVTTTSLAASAVTTAKIDASAVTTPKIKAGNVTTTSLAASAVTTPKIKAGNVTTTSLAASAVTATKIAASAVTTAKINTSAVTTAKIAASAITTTLINTTAVTAAKIAPNAVTTTKIAASAVTTPKIKAGNVTTTSLAASAVTTAKIDASAVTTPKIKAGNVTTTSLAASAVTTPKIKAGNVTTTSLAASAVTTAKIDASAVTTPKIKAGNVTTTSLAASAVTIDKISGSLLATILAPKYGVAWDESADTYIRTGGLAGVAVGSSPSDTLIPIQAAMRRCVINDAGVVQYYLDPADSTKRVGGGAADLTGADGQVMVEIPAFYYRYAYSGTTHTWEISQAPLSGFSLHPAFIKNDEFVPYRYIGAYEGALYDASAARYTNGFQLTARSTDFVNATSAITRTGESHTFTRLEVGDKIVVAGTVNNNGTFTVATTGDQTIIVAEALVQELAVATATIETEKDFANDILCSVSGKAPINDLTRANGRTIAAKRGTGWRQQDYDLNSAVQLLYLTEYADFYSQSMIGNGLTDWAGETWDGWNDYNPIETTGNSNGNGNATANTSGGGGVTGSYMSYRGIENFYGHIWKWVDGININANVPYISNNDTDFADDTTTNYTALGITLHNGEGWQNTLEQQDRGFLPASVGATSTTKITDYYWQAAGWRVVCLGGAADYGACAGVFCVYANYASSTVDRYFGCRLAY